MQAEFTPGAPLGSILTTTVDQSTQGVFALFGHVLGLIGNLPIW